MSFTQVLKNPLFIGFASSLLLIILNYLRNRNNKDVKPATSYVIQFVVAGVVLSLAVFLAFKFIGPKKMSGGGSDGIDKIEVLNVPQQNEIKMSITKTPAAPAPAKSPSIPRAPPPSPAPKASSSSSSSTSASPVRSHRAKNIHTSMPKF